MPLVGRDNRQAMECSGASNCRIIKIGSDSSPYSAVKHATGLERRTRSKRQRSGLIKIENRTEPTGQIGSTFCSTLAFEAGNAGLDLGERYGGKKELLVVCAYPSAEGSAFSHGGSLRRRPWREDRQRICVEQVARHHLTPRLRTILAGRLFGRSPGSSGGMASKRSAKDGRSEEHTSELQSLRHLVCRLLLEKK